MIYLGEGSMTYVICNDIILIDAVWDRVNRWRFGDILWGPKGSNYSMIKTKFL